MTPLSRRFVGVLLRNVAVAVDPKSSPPTGEALLYAARTLLACLLYAMGCVCCLDTS